MACRTFIAESDATVEVPDYAAYDGGQFNDDEGMDLIEPALRPSPADYRPLTEKIYLTVPPAQKADGRSSPAIPR